MHVGIDEARRHRLLELGKALDGPTANALRIGRQNVHVGQGKANFTRSKITAGNLTQQMRHDRPVDAFRGAVQVRHCDGVLGGNRFYPEFGGGLI